MRSNVKPPISQFVEELIMLQEASDLPGIKDQVARLKREITSKFSPDERKDAGLTF